MTDYLRRKAILATRLDGEFQNPIILALLRVMFGLPDEGDTQALDAAGVKWEGPDYSVKEFAAHASVGQWAVYKWLGQDAHFPVQFLPVFVAFVRAKSGGTDQRIAEYFADLSGFNERVRKIINAVEGR
jgi:hypothetical protein